MPASPKILNPNTGRWVKANGKIGKQLKKQCPPGKIINPETGRCVQADGKIGKRLLNQVNALHKIHIVFIPDLIILYNSSFQSSTSDLTLWKNKGICKFLDWYQSLSNIITEKLSKYHIKLVEFALYSKHMLELIIETDLITHSNVKAFEKALITDNKESSLRQIVKAVKYALAPDVLEEHIVVYQNQVYLIESIKIRKVIIK